MSPFGGIFDAPSALGMPVALSGAEVDIGYCDLSAWRFTESAKKVQLALREKGYSKLPADGFFQACSRSVVKNLSGEPEVSPLALQKLGINCGKFYIEGPDGACTSGMDQPDTSVQTPPEPVAPPTAAPPTQYLATNVKLPTFQRYYPAGLKYTVVPAGGGLFAGDSWKTYAAVGGVVLVVGVAAYFILK